MFNYLWLFYYINLITMNSLSVCDEFEEFKRRASTGGIVPLKLPLLINMESNEMEGKEEKEEGEKEKEEVNLISLDIVDVDYHRERAKSAGMLIIPPFNSAENLDKEVEQNSKNELEAIFPSEELKVGSDSMESSTLCRAGSRSSINRSPAPDDYLTLSSDEEEDCHALDDVPKIRLKRPSVCVHVTNTTDHRMRIQRQLCQDLFDTVEESGHFLSVDPQAGRSGDFLSVDPMPFVSRRRRSHLDKADTWDGGYTRERTASMPCPAEVRRAAWANRRNRSPSFTCASGCPLRKVRSFSISNKGEVQHEADIFVNKSNPSLTSVDNLYWCPGGHLSAESSCCPSHDASMESIDSEEGGPDEKYLVLVTGRTCVGKTSLIDSFVAETTIGNVTVGKLINLLELKPESYNIGVVT